MIEAMFSMPLYVTIPVVLIGYSITCLGVGLLVLRLFASPADQLGRVSAGTILAMGFTLGQGILASLWLLLALGDLFSMRIVGILCFLFAVIGLYLGRVLLPGLKKQVISIWQELREDTWGWQGIAALTFLLSLAWVTSLGRPFAGDATAFYMALSKVIAASHRLVPLPGYETYTNIWMQGELHYSVLMMLKSPDGARLFAWPTILAGAVILLAIGRRVGLGRRGQWIALAMLFTSSAITSLSGDGKVDLFAVPLGLAAYYWILQAHNGYKNSALWLTGLFSGFAIAAKLSYVSVMAPGILLLLFWRFREGILDASQRKQTLIALLKASGQIGAGLLICLAPQLVKNAILYQNPLAPLWTGGTGWVKQLWFDVETTRHIVATYPFALTLGDYWAQYGNISPLVLAFLPLAILLPKPRSLLASPLAAITLSALVGLLIWVATQPSVLAPRYILANLLLFILLPARAAEYVSENDTRPRWLSAGITISTAVTLIAAGLYFLNSFFFPMNTLRYLMSHMSECARDGTYCRALSDINRRAKPGERVYLATYYRYWLRPDLLQCVNGAKDPDIFLSDSNEELWTKLYQQGFYYLVVDRLIYNDALKKLNLDSPPAWLKLKLLYKEGILSVYQLSFDNPPVRQLKTCSQIHPPAWDVIDR